MKLTRKRSFSEFFASSSIRRLVDNQDIHSLKCQEEEKNRFEKPFLDSMIMPHIS